MPTPNWNTVRVQEQATVPEVDLLYAEFENEEYFHTEISDQYLTVAWSSGLVLPKVIEASHTHMGQAVNDDTYWSWIAYKDGTDLESNPMEIERTALDDPENIQYYTGAYRTGLLSWRSPQVKMIGGQVLHAEVNYGEESPRLDTIIGLIGATATPHVIAAIEKDVSPLVQKLNVVRR